MKAEGRSGPSCGVCPWLPRWPRSWPYVSRCGGETVQSHSPGSPGLWSDQPVLPFAFQIRFHHRQAGTPSRWPHTCTGAAGKEWGKLRGPGPLQIILNHFPRLMSTSDWLCHFLEGSFLLRSLHFFSQTWTCKVDLVPRWLRLNSSLSWWNSGSMSNILFTENYWIKKRFSYDTPTCLNEVVFLLDKCWTCQLLCRPSSA